MQCNPVPSITGTTAFRTTYLRSPALEIVTARLRDCMHSLRAGEHGTSSGVLFDGARDAAAISKLTKEEEAYDRRHGRFDHWSLPGFHSSGLDDE